MRSFFAASLLFLGTLKGTTGSPGHYTDTLIPRQDGTISIVQTELSLTFDYTTTKALESNWIGIWRADDTTAPNQKYVAWAYAPGREGTVQLKPGPLRPENLDPGKYRVWYLENGGTRILAGPVEVNHGVCIPPRSSVCLDGTVCTGSTPQCTVDARESKCVCCGAGQKAFYGKCYTAPDGHDIDVCLYNQKDRSTGVVCDLTSNNYCACLAGTNWSACRCCKATQYLSGVTGQCINK